MRYRLLVLCLLVNSLVSGQPYYELDSALSAGYSLYYHGDYDAAGKLFFKALREAKKKETDGWKLSRIACWEK